MNERLNSNYNDECLICGSKLKYLEDDILMECAICHKKEYSKVMCENGHYVCNKCHINGVDSIINVCLNTNSKNPIEIFNKLVELPFSHMHGPEHHIMVGASLLTAFHNCGGDIKLEIALKEMIRRGEKVPGGICGYWGCCGAAISSGIYISIITGSSPLSNEPFAFSNKMTSMSLSKIGEIGGPRCCKRNSYIAILEAILFTKENLNIEMESFDIKCSFIKDNNQCIGKRCPFCK